MKRLRNFLTIASKSRSKIVVVASMFLGDHLAVVVVKFLTKIGWILMASANINTIF